MNFPSLTSILDEREQLWQQKQKLVYQHKAALVSVSLRLPLEIRQEYPDIVLKHATILSKNWHNSIIEARALHSIDGPQWYAVIKQEARALKEQGIVQEQGPEGELLDIDVLDEHGTPQTRDMLNLPQRNCFICPRPAKTCSREKAHSLKELRQHMESLLYGTPQNAIHCLALLARLAVEDEARTTHKPGLVTPLTDGAHEDMDFLLLLRSSEALTTYWAACANLGQSFIKRPPPQLFSALRPLGQEAEKNMFAATQGINTHKGMIFGMGLLCAAAGALWTTADKIPSPKIILQTVQSMTQGLVRKELHDLSKANTAGERAFISHGITGARGQAESGYPAVLHTGLPLLQKYAPYGWHMAKAHALLGLMSVVQDTNVLRRGGHNALTVMQKSSHNVLKLGGLTTHQGRIAFTALQKYCLQHRLSPGGCADMLAMSCFFYRLQKYNESICP